ncbi:MAG: cohesin domain-containing protein, partial [Saprospiraceae bacterium]
EQHDFVGVKVGDVNGSVVANAFAGAEDRNTVGDLVFTAEDQQLKAGETYNIAINADNFNSIHGYQFTMSFDANALSFEGLQGSEALKINDSNFGLTKLNEGVITTSWTANEAQTLVRDAAVFTVSFTANADVKVSEVLSFNSRYTTAEAYNADLELMDVELRFENDEILTKELQLYQNRPNPFRQETVIGFDLPEASSAAILIYDASGKLLKQVEGDFEKGYNNISVSKEDLTPGLLHYQLVTPNGTATRKMIAQ